MIERGWIVLEGVIRQCSIYRRLTDDSFVYLNDLGGLRESGELF